MKAEKKIIIALSGLDPTGGAGISADIEVANNLNIHCCPLITTITSQNSQYFANEKTIDCKIILKQLKAIISEFKQTKATIKGLKIGLITQGIELKKISAFISKNIPSAFIVFDPIISPSSENSINEQKLIQNQLLYLGKNSIITPNKKEFFQLAQQDYQAKNYAPKDDAIIASLNFYALKGIYQILITSINSKNKGGDQFLEHWFAQFDEQKNQWKITTYFAKKLKAQYHGSGCTLATSLACFLAHNLPAPLAVQKALQFTHQSLVNSAIKGYKYHYPNRS